MEDELTLLEALYPGISIEKTGSKLVINYDHGGKVGLVTLRVSIEDTGKYPEHCRPQYSILRGLSIDAEKQLLNKILEECAYLEGDFCLVQVLGSFTSGIDEITPTCGICLDDIADDLLVTSPCFHVFHKSTCFTEWISHSQQNNDQRTETEVARTRRRQKESMGEAEVRMAQSRVDQLSQENTRLTERRTLLQARLQELSKQSVPNIKSRLDKNSVAERNKEDEETTDVAEIQRRLTDLSQVIKANFVALAGARKLLQNADTSLCELKAKLNAEKESELIRSQLSIPCPVCRTIVDLA